MEPVGAERLVAVLGDVVASRRHPDRERRLKAVGSALDLANGRVGATQPLTPTIGDEFQGLYGDLVSALDATLVVRLALLGEVDVRFGIGSGELLGYEASRAPFEQDGPAWWAAREAVDMVRDLEQRRERPRGLRTRWIDGGADGSPPVGAVNAFLHCRDELVTAMDPRDADIMLGLLVDEPLTSIAERLDVSVSAVSQRAIRGGLYAIRQAHGELREAVA
ncbi:MAG TPA: SatD family protein [Actinomycetota bacterium]|nr:SatD family protein [Actinomycetota bacterium]